MDARIKQIQAQMPSIIVSGLSLYFAVMFGLGGGKTLILLHQGTTDYAAAALAQAVGYAFGPAFAKVTLVAAAIGAVKLAIAGFFILAVTERSPAAMHGEAQHDYGALDLALHGAVAVTLLQALSGWIDGDGAAVRMHLANIMLLCVAVGTSMFEREAAARQTTRVGHLEATSNYRPDPDRPLPTGQAPLR
jgi:hypothetical protein